MAHGVNMRARPRSHRHTGPLLGLGGVFLLLASAFALLQREAAGQSPPPKTSAPRQLQGQGHPGGVDANGEPDCGDNAAFAALSARVMQSCCPDPAASAIAGGKLPSNVDAACWDGAYTAERCCDVARGPTGDASCWAGSDDFSLCCRAPPGEAETGSGECELPATCDSTECADEYLAYFDLCYPHLSALSPDVFQRFDAFKAGCEVSPFPLHPSARAPPLRASLRVSPRALSSCIEIACTSCG